MGWPEAQLGRYGALFPTPVDAVLELDRLGQLLGGLRVPEHAGQPARMAFQDSALESLQSYSLAVQALNLGGQYTLSFKHPLLRLAEVVTRHLETIPEVTSYRLVGSFFRTIAEDMVSTGDPDLVTQGKLLLGSLQRVRASRTEAPREAPPVVGGTTASLSEQFVAHYTQEVLAPEAEEEPLPPGNLTSEAVFRALLVECIRDGKFSRAETRCIAQIRDLLELSLKRHSAILKSVQAQFEAGKIARGEEMDPLDFFESCYRLAVCDGVVDQTELGLLGKLSHYLHLTRDEFEEIKARVAANP